MIALRRAISQQVDWRNEVRNHAMSEESSQSVWQQKKQRKWKFEEHKTMYYTCQQKSIRMDFPWRFLYKIKDLKAFTVSFSATHCGPQVGWVVLFCSGVPRKFYQHIFEVILVSFRIFFWSYIYKLYLYM